MSLSSPSVARAAAELGNAHNVQENMKTKPGFYIGLMVVALTASACATPRATDTLLHFTEQDRDGRVLATHMRANREYLRMDDGADGDFVLLDRGARMVYSVSAADQTILVIKPLPLTLARPPVFEQGIERDAAVFPRGCWSAGSSLSFAYQWQDLHRGVCRGRFVAGGGGGLA